MSIWAGTLIVLASMVAGPGEGQIRWARSWKVALREAKTRNVPLFLSCLKDGCSVSQGRLATELRDPTLVAYLNEMAVPLAAHTADTGLSHEPEEHQDPRTGETSFRCPIYKTITCTEHNYIYSRAQDLFDLKEIPRCFVLGPEGKPVEGSGEVKGGKAPQIVIALRRVQKKLGKPLRRSAFSRGQERLKTGRAAIGAEEFPRAIRTLQALAGDRKAPKMQREEARVVLSEINEIGLLRLAKAKETLEEDREAGLKLLRKLKSQFKGLDAAKAARGALVDEGKAKERGR